MMYTYPVAAREGGLRGLADKRAVGLSFQQHHPARTVVHNLRVTLDGRLPASICESRRPF